MLRSIKQSLFLRIPTDVEWLYRFCRHYSNRHEGELNGDMDTNGEMWLAGQACPGARVVFDVGANRGEWSRRVLQENPALQLHAFEPSSQTYESLVRNVPGVIANQFGLSSTASEAVLYLFGEGHQLNSVYKRQSVEPTDETHQQNSSEAIVLRTLDDYCAEHDITFIDLLKIDVEGHDLEVLRGAESMLRSQSVHLIQFEYSGCNLDSGHLLGDFFEYLSGVGYSLAKLLPNAIRPVPEYHRGLETFRYQNWVAYPTESRPQLRLARS